MFSTLPSRRNPSLRCGSLLCVFLPLFGVTKITASSPDSDKSDVENPLAHLRAYLPAIRRKALLDNERQYVVDLKRCYKLSKVYAEGGLVDRLQLNRIEEAILHGRIRVLGREADYRDSLDQFAQRFTTTAKQRRQMEDATISPLANLLRRYEKLSRDSERACRAMLQQSRVEDAAKLRAALVQILTTAALVKDTALPKRFGKEWSKWEKIDRIENVREKIKKIREDFFASCLGNLELHLRDYEKQPWKDTRDGVERTMRQNESFRRIVTYSRTVADVAYRERFARLVRSWPSLATLQLKDVDLLTCDADKAEQIVAALRKTPDAQMAGKKKVRQLRMLAKSYRIQQELFALVFLRREHLRDDQYLPKILPLPKALPADPTGSSGPVAEPPTIDNSAFEAQRAIDAHRSLSRAKLQLLQSWIEYQMARLDMYSDMGLSPP